MRKDDLEKLTPTGNTEVKKVENKANSVLDEFLLTDCFFFYGITYRPVVEIKTCAC